MKRVLLPLLSTLLLICGGSYAIVTDPLQYVDQLIGTQAGGNVFAGASLPYGMAKAVADTDSSSNQGGFTTDGANVTGFSSMHDSGTGGSPSLGLFPLFAYSSCPDDEDINTCIFPKRARATPFVNETLRASPGFFGLRLESGVEVEMTAAMHTSLFRFTFDGSSSSDNDGSANSNSSDRGKGSGSGSPIIFLDLTDLSNSRQDNASISINAETGRMQGESRFKPSFGQGDYIAYFCADFLPSSSSSEIKDTGIFVDSRASVDVKEVKISRGINGAPPPAGAFIRFTPSSSQHILARVGLSFKSSSQACSLAEEEIPTFDFEETKDIAEGIWRQKLSVISVSTNDGVGEEMLRNFYSGVYRTLINPQNYTGVVPVVGEDTIYFDSFYCIWDLFRSQLPFLTILDQPAVEDMLQGLLTLYRLQGWLPDCHMSLNKGYTQGGSNADVVMADAYLKIRSSKIDWDLVYEAVVKDAEEEPYDWCCQGRGGLDSWKALNYIPVSDFDYKGFGTMTRSVSRTLEYSYNDFCISLIASGLGHLEDVEKYQTTSTYWTNLFNPTQPSLLLNTTTSTGFTGFFQPKHLNQTWSPQDPLKCSNIDTSPSSICSLQVNAVETYESSIWEYSFYVPHDQARLITLLGGDEAFVQRLDYLHDTNITYIGNEPSFLTVFQYHYAGRPGLSAKRAHFYIPRFFSPTLGGLPGNDDSGTMGAFVAFAMMGLFPNPGQDVYLISAPFFEDVNVTSSVTGKVARVRCVGFDNMYERIYIQRAEVDGREWTRNWIGHEFFREGGELVLWLGREESEWGTRIEDRPPSLSGYS